MRLDEDKLFAMTKKQLIRVIRQLESEREAASRDMWRAIEMREAFAHQLAMAAADDSNYDQWTAMNSPIDWRAHVGAGWTALIEPLIEKCAREGVTILQVKEKFAGLRFYVAEDNATPELRAQIYAAEEQSLKTCEDCGKPGRQHEMRGGWLKTLCDEHAGAYHAKRG